MQKCIQGSQNSEVSPSTILSHHATHEEPDNKYSDNVSNPEAELRKCNHSGCSLNCTHNLVTYQQPNNQFYSAENPHRLQKQLLVQDVGFHTAMSLVPISRG